MQKMRLAIIGAGPAGIYAADILNKMEKDFEVSIDLFDHLPAPYGLVRYGVAPDHPRIKGIVNALKEVLDSGSVRFFGNVRYGQDLHLSDLKRHYHAVIFATGAVKDSVLEIPGIDAISSYGAADFVSWFDGHPDVDRSWQLDAEEVAVIGNGNVALDVARILAKHADDLLSTEIPDNVYEVLKNSKVTDVHVFGRRGPTQVKFTPLELRELGEVNDVDVILYEEDFLVEDSYAETAKKTNKQIMVIDRVLNSWRNNKTGSSRRLHLHFYAKPHEVITDDQGRVSALRIERTKPLGDGTVTGTGEYVDYRVQSIYRAVGYFGSPLPDVPFDYDKGVIVNDSGRVLDSDSKTIPGMYATGWIKRGPVGLIGHTKSDALETLHCLMADRDNLWQPEFLYEDAINDLLAQRGIVYTDVRGWQLLDEYEITLGVSRDRARMKVVSREDMIRISTN